jgi:hypothetical protein
MLQRKPPTARRTAATAASASSIEAANTICDGSAALSLGTSASTIHPFRVGSRLGCSDIVKALVEVAADRLCSLIEPTFDLRTIERRDF